MNRKKRLNISWPKIFLAMALLASFGGALVSTKTLAVINKNIKTAKEDARPAKVKIVKITAPDCQDCFNVETAAAEFKKLNVQVDEEKALIFDSPEATALIKQLGIKKVPTYLVTGEVTKTNLENFVKSNGEIKENTFIFTRLSPVFLDTETGQEKGRVIVTLITDSFCSQCPDLKVVVENFQKAGVKIKERKERAWNSLGGQELINQYKITKVPTFIFSPEFDLYEAGKSTWKNFGTVEADKTYVARNLSLPYRDLAKGQIVGLVDLIYLIDSNCPDCYKVAEVQKPILTKGYGVAVRSERTVEATSFEGKNLISQYSIVKIPTVLLSPEVDQYSNLKNVWGNVGTVGTDGWYVFTGFNQLGKIVYKDLTNNQIIRPDQQPSPSPTN